MKLRIYGGNSGVNPGEVLGSGPHQLFALPGSAYWWTHAQFSQNISIIKLESTVSDQL